MVLGINGVQTFWWKRCWGPKRLADCIEKDKL